MLELQPPQYTKNYKKDDSTLESTFRLLCILNENERAYFGIDELIQQESWDYICIDSKISSEDWRKALKKYNPDIIIGAWSMPPLDKLTLSQVESLKYVCYLCGSVRKRVDREFLLRGGIITNWGSAASRMVAECALSLILASLRQLTRYALEFHIDKIWNSPGSPIPLSLFQRKVGIHGFGHVARELIHLLEPFKCSITAYSEPVPSRIFDSYGITCASSLEDLFANSDIVVEAEALNPMTIHTVTEDHLRLLGAGGVFVNIARGALVAPGAIEAIAAEGKVQFGLDVYEPEPMPSNCQLRGMRNVTLTPHIAGPTRDRYEDCTLIAMENLKRFFHGKELKNSLSIEQYDIAT